MARLLPVGRNGDEIYSIIVVILTGVIVAK